MKSIFIILTFITFANADSFSAKELFPLDGSDVFLFISLLLIGIVCAGVGVGGGGLFVPLLIAIAKFDPKNSVALSNALIAGGSIGNYLQLSRKRNVQKPLVDYDLALLMEPLTLLGTIIGVIFNTIFPNWLILGLLAIVLVVSSVRTCQKGIRLHQTEQNESTIEVYELESASESRYSDSPLTNTPTDPEYSLYPKWHIGGLAILLIILALSSLLKGSQTNPSILGIETCSAVYWIFTWLPVPFMVIVTIIIGHYLLKKEFQFEVGEINWTRKRTALVSTTSTLAGLMASLVGIGGAMILSPIMIELGVLPEVIVATSSFMICFTTIGSIIQFLVLGQLPYDYGLALFLMGLITSFIGQKGIRYLVNKYQKKSLIILIIGTLIVIASVLLLITGTINIIDTVKSGEEMGFKSLCKNPKN